MDQTNTNKVPSNAEMREEYFVGKKIEFETSCDQGSATACFSLGEWYQLVKKDLKMAGKIYDENCFKRNNANSCFNLAMLYLSGQFTEKGHTIDEKLTSDATPVSVDKDLSALDTELERGVLLHNKACDLGNGQACTAAGQFKLAGLGCKKDVDGALERYKTACDRDDAIACFRLGGLLLQGERHEVKREPEKAFKYMEKGCSLGHPNACQVLAVMYRKGDGVEKDMKKFEQYRSLTMDIIKQTGEKLGATVVE